MLNNLPEGRTFYLAANLKKHSTYFEIGTLRNHKPVLGMIWGKVPDEFLIPEIVAARNRQEPIRTVLCTLCENCLGNAADGNNAESITHAKRTVVNTGCGQQCSNPVRVEEV